MRRQSQHKLRYTALAISGICIRRDHGISGSRVS
jgi:hypothetical protein